MAPIGTTFIYITPNNSDVSNKTFNSINSNDFQGYYRKGEVEFAAELHDEALKSYQV